MISWKALEGTLTRLWNLVGIRIVCSALDISNVFVRWLAPCSAPAQRLSNMNYIGLFLGLWCFKMSNTLFFMGLLFKSGWYSLRLDQHCWRMLELCWLRFDSTSSIMDKWYRSNCWPGHLIDGASWQAWRLFARYLCYITLLQPAIALHHTYCM